VITSDGRSEIEAEMEQMRPTGPDGNERRLKSDCRDHTLNDAADTTEFNYPPDPPSTPLTRWLDRILTRLVS
jgi:hypothetical protein